MNGLTWGLQRLDIEACWQQGFTGKGVRIGHLDTGVDGTHPALNGRVVEYAEFDSDGFAIPDARPADSGSHGTHIAGLICGRPCDQLSIGVAPDAELCSGMVIDGGKALVRILAGLDWMLACDVRVLCISLGVPNYNPLFEVVLKRLRRRGVLVVSPVGNRGSGRTCSPANYAGVMAIGATDCEDRVAHFSGSQLYKRAADYVKPNLVAPGVNIPSARPGGGLETRSGTSMAAAYVAGVAALLWQAKPEATVEDVEKALLTTCDPLSEVMGYRRGRGLVNPLRALDAIRTGLLERSQHGTLH